MAGKLTEAGLTANPREIWAMVDDNPTPNTILVAPTTIRKIEAVIEFNKRLRWWRRAFYWVFRGKHRRDLQKWVTARVPDDLNAPPPFSGLDRFLSITPDLAAEQYEREVRSKR